MKEKGTVAVLAYLLFATFAEVLLVNAMAVWVVYYTLIGAIAISKAVVVGAYYMRLKYESFSIMAISFVGVMFISILVVSILLNYIRT
jgi:hypothetical protein